MRLKNLKRGFELGDDLTTSHDAFPIEHLKDQPLSVEQAGYDIGKNRI